MVAPPNAIAIGATKAEDAKTSVSELGGFLAAYRR
jgi:hypothetical protein